MSIADSIILERVKLLEPGAAQPRKTFSRKTRLATFFIIVNQYTVQVFYFVCHLNDDTNEITGCRTGGSCPFIHDASRSASSTKQPNQRRDAQEPSDGTASTRPSGAIAGQSTGSITRDNAASLQSAGRQPLQPLRPVPIAQQKDPRAFQISQVKRRFSPEEVRAL